MTEDIFQQLKHEFDECLLHWDDCEATGEFEARIEGVSPWLAVSLLQKAIRRGDAQWALVAVRLLIKLDPDRLWRRLLVIAYEDIGMGDLSVLAHVTVACRSRRTYEKHGMSEQVCAYLAVAMAKTVKCRATDDLYVVMETQPTAIEDLQRVASGTLPELIHVLFETDADIAQRGLALWAALGIRAAKGSDKPHRRGSPKAVFDIMGDNGWPLTLTEMARSAYSKTGEVICGLLPLLYSANDPAPDDLVSSAIKTVLPEAVLLQRHRIPVYAADYFTREGRTAMRRFMETECDSAKLIRAYIHPKHQIDELGSLLFRIQSSQVDQRLRNAQGLDLKWRADELTVRSYGTHQFEIYEVFKSDLPFFQNLLNK